MLSLSAHEPSAVGEVRRAARQAGRRAGLDEEALGRLAIVCTEATENLVRHGRGGEVLLGATAIEGRAEVELIALDRGPGIADIEAAFADGYSTAGTAGCGLGALRRLSDGFDIHSVVGVGTAVLVRVGSRAGVRSGAASSRQALLDVGAIRVARRGESRCGDAVGSRAEPGLHALCLIDGLGHGEAAADAAECALAAFEGGAGTRSAARLDLMTAGSAGTRGAVASVVTCSPAPADGGLSVEHTGVGNVTTALHAGGRHPARFVTVSGTLGRASTGRANRWRPPRRTRASRHAQRRSGTAQPVRAPRRAHPARPHPRRRGAVPRRRPPRGRLRGAGRPCRATARMSETLLELLVSDESVVALARRRAREIVAALGLDTYRQVRVATAVSEIVRNAHSHARDGRVVFELPDGAPCRLVVRVSDAGGAHGAAETAAALSRTDERDDAHGLGIARRLADAFELETDDERGTTVSMSFDLGEGACDPAAVRALRAALPEPVRVDEARELRENNALLHASLAEAEAAVASREELLAIVSHDLRNPLGAIVTSAEGLEYAELEGEAGEFVTEMQGLILSSARHMDKLIGDLLDLASHAAGTLAVDPSPHDGREIVTACARACAAAAAARGLTLVHAGTPGPLLQCDRERTLQILANLVGNAIKFSAAGERIVLDVRPDGRFARFSVTDSGRGMDPDELAHLFERHWQRDSGDRRGIGLGMSIVKALVEAHGGEIDVDSEPGRGTRVRVGLPLAGPDPPPSPAAAPK